MISVGLELCGNSIRIAVLDGTRAGAKLVGFDVRRIDAKKGDAEDDIVTVIDEAMRRLNAPRAAVVCSVRAQECTIREILVPFLEDDKIRKTVKYQAENFFTSLSIDDLVIEYSKFGEVAQKSKLLVAGIRKSHVARRLALLEECGIDPLAIDLDVAALFNAYAHLGVFEGKGAALIVEVKADNLKVGVVEDGRLRLARAVRMRLGSMRLDGQREHRKELTDSGVFDTAADESARLPVVILDDGDDEAFSLEDSGITESEREGILHRVFMEIDRTVASVQLKSEIELICLTGPSCALDGIEQVFAGHFEIESRRIDIATPLGAPPDKQAKGEPSLSLEGATAVGLALKGLGIDHAGMDFRQEEFVYRGTFGQLKRGLACTLTLLFALVFLYAFHVKQQKQEKQGTLLGVRTMQRNLYTVLFPALEDPSRPHDPLPRPNDYLGSLMHRQQELRNTYGAGLADAGPKLSSLEVLRQFAVEKSRVDQNRFGQIKVTRISVDPRPGAQSRFVCTVPAEPAGIELARNFENNEVLSGTAREFRPERDGNGWSFELIVRLRDTGR